MTVGVPDVVRLWPTPTDTTPTPVAASALHTLIDLVLDVNVGDAHRVVQLLDVLDDNDIAAVQMAAATLADVSSAAREARARLGRPVATSEQASAVRACSVCGCTDNRACLDFLGRACFWVGPFLCSECEGRGGAPDGDG